MVFSRNPASGTIECYTDDGIYMGIISTMGDFVKNDFAQDGGPGSGNHDHDGRPGEVGGSLPKGESSEKKTLSKPTKTISVEKERERHVKNALSFLKKARKGIGKSRSEEELDNLLYYSETLIKNETLNTDERAKDVFEYLDKFIRWTEGDPGWEERRELAIEAKKSVEEILKTNEREKEEIAASSEQAKGKYGSIHQKVSHAEPPKDAEPILGSFIENSVEYNRKRFAEEGVSEEEVAEAERVLATLFDKGEYGMRVPSELLETIIDGGFKNQFQTGTSRGMLDPFQRKISEEMLFRTSGRDSEIPDEARPKYGLLMSDVYGGGSEQAKTYGGCSITFKKKRLAGKVTYTLSDSLMIRSRSAAGSVSVGKTTLGGLFGPREEVKWIIGAGKDAESGDVSSFLDKVRSPYIELQYHGSLTIDDVETICFNSEEERDRHLSEEKEKLLKSKGIKIFYKNPDGTYTES